MKKLAFLSAAVLAAAFSAQALAAPPAATTDKPVTTSTAKPPKAAKPAKVAEKTAKGVVDSWAADTRMLSLKGGDSFKVADSVKTTAFKTGESVTVRYTEKDGAKIADHVKAAAAAKPKAKKS